MEAGLRGAFYLIGLFFGFVGVEWLGEGGGSEPQNVELRNIECRREAGGRFWFFDGRWYGNGCDSGLS